MSEWLIIAVMAMVVILTLAADALIVWTAWQMREHKDMLLGSFILLGCVSLAAAVAIGGLVSMLLS